MRRLLPPLLLLALTSFAWAIPSQNFDKLVQEYQRSEGEKQIWLKPGKKKEHTGDFVARLRKEAAAGNVDSQATLALCMYLGFGTNRNVAGAVEWYQKAAAAGHAGAQNNLAGLYDSGMGVPLDHAKAFELYLASAQLGFAEAEFNVALDYAKGEGVTQDWEQARLWYEKDAAQGSLAALTNLGNIYLLGRGVPVDYARARSYLQKPADAGVGLAQNSLGLCAGWEGKTAEASSWFKRSAEHGFPIGEYHWASALAAGRGVKQDLAEALTWARKATNNSLHIEPDKSADAHALIADILSHGPVDKNGAEAFREATLAASMGSGEGDNALGVCYYSGIGVEINLEKAAECYRRGAERKSIWAVTNLGHMLETGKGVPKDFVEAAKCYRIGAEAGNDQARASLGRLNLEDLGMEINYQEAVKWLAPAYGRHPDDHQIANDYCRAAAKLGHELETVKAGAPPPNFAEAAKWYRIAAEIGQPYAENRLGVFYRDGTGVETNLQEAVKWLRLAAKTAPVPEFQADLADAERQLKQAPPAIPVISHAEIFDQDVAQANTLRAALARSPSDFQVKKNLAEVAGKIGLALEKGAWVPQSMTEAAKWYRIAADAGNPVAEFRLGLFYRDGTGVDANPDEAVKWLRLATKDSPNDPEIKAALSEAERELKTHTPP